MPTYEYQCTVCAHRFDKVQSFSDEPIKTCPNCGEPVKKVFSPAGIIFKGSGWYINDSKKTTSSVTPAPAKDGEAKSDTATPAPATTEKADSSSSSPAASSSDTAA